MPAVLDGTNGLTFNDGSIQASVAPAVRQTVLSGPVGVNGFAAFGGATGATTVTATGTLLLSAAAGGNANRAGLTTNPSWTGLSTNGTMFLFLNITAAGVVTTGSTTLEPTYRWGGADVVTNNQNTFNIQQMEMKVGNGSVATQVFRVFVGEVTVAGGVVSAITWYALMRRYENAATVAWPAAGVPVTLTHNVGNIKLDVVLEIVCVTAEAGYAIGDVLIPMTGPTGGYAPVPTWHTRNSAGFVPINITSLIGLTKTTGAGVGFTNANWNYRLKVKGAF